MNRQPQVALMAQTTVRATTVASLLLGAVLAWPAQAADQALAAGAAAPDMQSAIEFPGGGMVWATEDPQLAQPAFSVSAPAAVPFERGHIKAPVRFYSYSNYVAFAERIELRIFNGTDLDLVQPLATVEIPLRNVAQAEWDGRLPQGLALRPGDELQYVARVIAPNGSFDETIPRRLQLVRPADVERQQQQLLESATGSLAGLPVRDLQDRQQLERTFGRSDLRIQNISTAGSRVRIRGQGIPRGTSVTINGDPAPVDLEGRLAVEYVLPVGVHRFVVQAGRGPQSAGDELIVTVTGKYFFMVALADATLSGNSISGSVVPAGVDEAYDDVLGEGRLAFYLKGKVQGKYLVTAQADTGEREVSELFDGFLRPDAGDVFRRLDPDRYYPVYGDDSGTYRDIDTQGRLYVRVDWDQNEALWGNFATGFAGSEYGQYVRSLYGAALSWRSQDSTPLGEARRSLRAFGSEAQSALGHSEFIGTGGSLYYLRDTDLLPGSESVTLEVRDRTTGRVASRRQLERGADYEIDELQGRVLLTRPLVQLLRENAPGITRDAPLDGLETRLLVDYEYVPAGFSADDVSAGAQGRFWLNDRVAVGGTFVDENRRGDDYRLGELDLTLQAGRGTYLRVEQARSEATVAPVFFSNDGGLSFVRQNVAPDADREGDARSVEARANLRELGWTGRDWTVGGWWREVEPGFSVARADTGMTVEEVGAEFSGELGSALRLSGRYSDAERGANGIEQGQLLLEWSVREDALLSSELRRVTETRLGAPATGALAALGYSQRFNGVLDLYGVAQLTVDDDGGAYADNDLYTLGVRHLFGDLSSVGAEGSTGDRGDAVSVNAEYRVDVDHSLYAGYVHSTDDSALEPVLGERAPAGLTLGQRWRVTDHVSVFNESQSLRQRSERGIAHSFGINVYPSPSWNVGLTLQRGDLETLLGETDRRAASVSGGYRSVATSWNSKLEYRRDSGLAERRQWVSTNRLTHRFNDDWRIVARLNYGDTDDELDALGDARFVEGGLGFAYRPAWNDRWNVLGKFTHLYDVGSLGQTGAVDYDQRSQVWSLEGIYRLDRQWEMAGKLARREGEARPAHDTGSWLTIRPTSRRCRRALPRSTSGTRWQSTAGWRRRTAAAPARAGWSAWTATSAATSALASATTSPVSAITSRCSTSSTRAGSLT